MARTYHRDANGRFASGGGDGSSRPARKAAPTKAGNRLNRDNAGKITGIGKDGATARGGRIRTAGGKQRATQTARMASAGRAGAMRGKVKRDPAAGKAGAKGYRRGVDAAKVERMMERLRGARNYSAFTKRLRYAKEESGGVVRQRAVDFLHKQGGFVAGQTRGGRKSWRAPDGLTREQALRNVADSIPKLPRRSTAKAGNKKIVSREQKRQQKIADRLNPPHVSYMHGGGKSKSAPSAPLRQSYDGSTGRGSGATKSAAKRQAERRQVVRTLRGLGPSNSSKIRRGVAKQRTLFGGTAKTGTRFRRVAP